MRARDGAGGSQREGRGGGGSVEVFETEGETSRHLHGEGGRVGGGSNKEGDGEIISQR